MNLNRNRTIAATCLPLLAISSLLPAARNGNREDCSPTPPAACNPDACCRIYCMGPDNYAVNAPVRPKTCDGDWVVTIAGFYWNAHEDGLEYAILTQTDPDERLNLIDAEFKNPDFEWNFGFKVGIGYNTTCDGWDVGILWTRYRGKAFNHDEASQSDEDSTLIMLWSKVFDSQPVWTRVIDTSWAVQLDLVDIELGREFWSSKRLSLRPFVGIRIPFIRQDYEIQNQGGSFTSSVTDVIYMQNNYKGVGVRAGLNSVWNVGCGFGLFGEMALSIIYGRFYIDQSEVDRLNQAPFAKRKFFEVEDQFRASRLITDLTLGIQWSALFCDCKYGFTAQLGWEQHMFLSQNQLWRIPNINGLYQHTRGDLDTQGWTLTLRFEF